MSCISKILEVKGDKKIIINGEVAIEGGGVYKDYEYLITFTIYGNRCGYVAIPPSHPLYKYHNPEYNFPNLEVHGGVTFFEDARFDDITGIKCTDKWIGFDAAHCYDLEDMETSEKYFGETRISKYKKNNPSYSDHTACHRSYSYMEEECKELIEQIVEKAQ